MAPYHFSIIILTLFQNEKNTGELWICLYSILMSSFVLKLIFRIENEDGDQEWSTPKPAKRVKQTACIIHCTNSEENLTKPSLESWKSLLAVAERQNHKGA